ncbi:hypothetical protein DCC62_28475 [candidate division KSB1 bacterium]|nr:MAG: hypothetical protein DCC62_28475 [candidate division KSB1 bacterium]
MNTKPKNVVRITAFLAAVLLAFAVKLHAQGCCTAGSAAIESLEHGVIPFKRLNLNVNYRHAHLGNTFEATRRRAKLMIPSPARPMCKFLGLRWNTV